MPAVELSPLRDIPVKAANGTNASKPESPLAQPTIVTNSISLSSPPTNPPTAGPTIFDDSASTVTPGNHTGGIFYCGWVTSGLAHAVFPDYVQRTESLYETWKKPRKRAWRKLKPPNFTRLRDPQPEDILIFGLHGPCNTPLEDFPGKVLVVNGEPTGGNVVETKTLIGRNKSQDICQMGTVPNGPNTINCPFMMWGIFLSHYDVDTSILSKFSDHSKKPINNGKHNAIIYINRSCHGHREVAVNEISTMIPVHAGGKCKGAQPRKGTFVDLPRDPQYNFFRNFEIQQDYRFCFTMENTNLVGYVSEKIMNAFLPGCIPVYYGTPEIFDFFNRKAFVYYDVDDPQPALQQLRDLSHNETLYNEMLYNQPILAEGNETLRKHFSLMDEIGGGFLKQQIRNAMGV